LLCDGFQAVFVVVSSLKQILKKLVFSALFGFASEPLAALRRILGSLLKNGPNVFCRRDKGIPSVYKIRIILA